MTIGKIKGDTTEPQFHVIPEVEKPQKSNIRVERTSTHNYKTRPITKRFNHVTMVKTAPNMFKMDAEEKTTTNI